MDSTWERLFSKKEKSFMADEILLDSNILVYAYDASEASKNKIAKGLLENCFNRNRRFFVSIQNLNEFFITVTKKIERPMDKSEALGRVKNIMDFNGFNVLVPTSEATITAIHLNISSGSHYWDCFLAATMLENRVFRIYTENVKDFSRFPGVLAENPFAV